MEETEKKILREYQFDVAHGPCRLSLLARAFSPQEAVKKANTHLDDCQRDLADGEDLHIGECKIWLKGTLTEADIVGTCEADIEIEDQILFEQEAAEEEYCPEHGKVSTQDDEGIARCPQCGRATSTTPEEAARYERQEGE
jgi:hypothetical protein